MILLVKTRDGDDQQAVVLAYVAAHQRGGAVRPRTVGDEQLLVEGVLQVGHLRFVKFQIAHECGMKIRYFLGCFAPSIGLLCSPSERKIKRASPETMLNYVFVARSPNVFAEKFHFSLHFS